MKFRYPWRRAVLPVAVLGSIAFHSGAALAAGAAYQVDTAEVSQPGSCKVESWLSKGSGGDYIAATSPACVVSFFKPVDISAQYADARVDGERSMSITPKAKINLIPTGIGVWGFGLSGAASIDTQTGETTAWAVTVPATLRLSNTARINLNVGYQRDRGLQRDFATYGAGVDLRTADNVWIVTAEIFGVAGPSLEDASPGNNRPRMQAGLRWRPIDPLSFDIIYGRNLAGERNQWVTFATVYRFSLFGSDDRPALRDR